MTNPCDEAEECLMSPRCDGYIGCLVAEINALDDVDPDYVFSDDYVFGKDDL
jgi:hypothetical protein